MTSSMSRDVVLKFKGVHARGCAAPCVCTKLEPVAGGPCCAQNPSTSRTHGPRLIANLDVRYPAGFSRCPSPHPHPSCTSARSPPTASAGHDSPLLMGCDRSPEVGLPGHRGFLVRPRCFAEQRACDSEEKACPELILSAISYERQPQPSTPLLCLDRAISPNGPLEHGRHRTDFSRGEEWLYQNRSGSERYAWSYEQTTPRWCKGHNARGATCQYCNNATTDLRWTGACARPES